MMKMDQFRLTSCPYCSSKDLAIVFESCRPTILHVCPPEEANTSQVFPIHVALCKKCGLGFNSTPLPDDVLETIYRKFRYIKPSNNIGTSKYSKFLQMIERNVHQNEYVVEIGASDGFVLDTLIDEGYLQIEGFEPSQEWNRMNNKGKIRNEFFTDKSSFSKPVGAFLLMHVLEHFSSPWDIMETMKEKLDDGKKIIFEVPYFSGFYHYHLVYFTDTFTHRIARDLGFDILEKEIDGDVLRVCLKKKNTLVSDKHTPADTTEYLVKRLEDKKAAYLNYLEYVRLKISETDNIFWWGTGSTSVMLLNDLGEKICSNKLFTFIDSDEERKGLVFPLPYLSDFQIELPSEACPKMQPDHLLVIASSFSGEILDQIGESGYTLPEKVISSIRMI